MVAETKVKTHKHLAGEEEEVAYKFRNEQELSEIQLTDPDYRLKQLMKGNGAHPAICSKCHHCR